jgi:hypothetical protein
VIVLCSFTNFRISLNLSSASTYLTSISTGYD